nr:hypothetical protein GCM10017745_50790 [Saccharothrix mutabilis subsp. capreolus]
MGSADSVRRCSCGTRLARDNRSDRCSACARAGRRQLATPPRVPAEFWDPDLRAALTARDIGAVIRAYRKHPHHAQPIRQETAAAWINLSPTRLSRVENGEPVNDLAKLIHWAHRLGIPHHLLWFHMPTARLVERVRERPGNPHLRNRSGQPDRRSTAARSTGTELADGAVAPSAGSVSGFVLALSRQAAELTQDQLAELLGVDVDTVQGWESGRHPLAAVGSGELLRLSARLTRAGAPASTRRHLNDAIEADLVLATGITAGAAWVDATDHPLAAAVHRKNITNLVTWPFTGHTPPQLAELVQAEPRQDLIGQPPWLQSDERARFFDHLLFIAERAAHAGEPLLRRQAVYLLGFDQRRQVGDWLRGEWHRVGRMVPTENDITGLFEARSASVALASTGEGEHIHDFVDRTAGTRAEAANLNYWAYWIGELGDVRTDDSFMNDADTRSWNGGALLSHLTRRLDPDAPHLPLNLHTLHALVASRPALLDARPRLRASLTESLDKLATGDTLTRSGRDQVAGLHYALRITGH